MRKTRYFLLGFAILSLFAFSSMMSVKGAYLVDNGTEWSYDVTYSGSTSSMGVKVTSVTASSVIATVRGSTTGGTAEVPNTSIGGAFVLDEASIAIFAAVSTEETKTYGGKSLTVYVCTVTGYTTLNIDKVTGIVLEMDVISSYKIVLSAWTYGGGIPGYELPILLGIVAIGTIGIIYTMMKRK